MNNIYTDIFEVGKKVANLHITCLAGLIAEKSYHPIAIQANPSLKPHTNLTIEPGLNLDRETYVAFNGIHRYILSHCVSCPITEPKQQFRSIGRRTKSLVDGISYVKSVVDEVALFGDDGVGFFRAGILVRLIKMLSGRYPELKMYENVIRTRASSLFADDADSGIWILPGEMDFLKSGFDFTKLGLSGSAGDILRQYCVRDGISIDVSCVEVDQAEKAIMELAIKKTPGIYQPVVTPRIIEFSITGTENISTYWSLTVKHTPSPSKNSLEKTQATFKEFSINGKRKIEQLLRCISTEHLTSIDDTASKKPLSSIFKTDSKDKSGESTAFRDFYSGLMGSNSKIKRNSSYCKAWLNRNIDEIKVYVD